LTLRKRPIGLDLSIQDLAWQRRVTYGCDFGWLIQKRVPPREEATSPQLLTMDAPLAPRSRREPKSAAARTRPTRSNAAKVRSAPSPTSPPRSNPRSPSRSRNEASTENTAASPSTRPANPRLATRLRRCSKRSSNPGPKGGRSLALRPRFLYACFPRDGKGKEALGDLNEEEAEKNQ
jgi:hypothetical protein